MLRSFRQTISWRVFRGHFAELKASHDAISFSSFIPLLGVPSEMWYLFFRSILLLVILEALMCLVFLQSPILGIAYEDDLNAFSVRNRKLTTESNVEFQISKRARAQERCAREGEVANCVLFHCTIALYFNTNFKNGH